MVQAQILQLLQRLSEELGLAIVLITHDLPIVAQTCQTAAVMYAGRVAELGPTVALHDDPRHPYTRMLFAATPDLGGTSGVASIPGAPPRLDQPLVACPFAPRCDSTFETCRTLRPPLLTVGPGHKAACHLAAAVPA
jgi:oligopeptide/dipeptide ABC transporter ATP-binding protein